MKLTRFIRLSRQELKQFEAAVKEAQENDPGLARDFDRDEWDYQFDVFFGREATTEVAEDDPEL